MKKKLIAGMTSAAVIASIGAPAFANSHEMNFTDVQGHWAADAINKLVEKGILNGMDNTHFNPDGTLTRAQFAKIVAVSLGLDVSATTSSFSDVSGWAVGYVEAAKKAGLIDGVGNGQFDPNGIVTREQAAKIMVNALKTKVQLEDATELNFSDASKIADWAKPFVAVAVKYGLITGLEDGSFGPQGSATRAQAAVLADRLLTKAEEALAPVVETVNAVANADNTVTVEGTAKNLDKVTVHLFQDGNKVFEQEVSVTDGKFTVTTEALAAGKYTVHVQNADKSAEKSAEVEVTALLVESVSANNLIEAVVTFSKAVDKTTAETAANYAVKVAGVDKVVTAKLNADGKSVTLTLPTKANQQDTIEVTVENVKDTSGAVVSKTTVSTTALDTTLPVALSAAVSGPSTVEVTFSEPIQTQGAFKLNNGTYYVAYASGAGTNKLTLNVGSLAEGTYTLNVADAVDYAGFKSASTDLTFTYAKDTVAPTVSIDSVTQTKAVLKFNEAITNDTSLSVYHTYNNVAAYAGTAVYSSADKTLTVTFANPIPTGTVTLFVNNATTSPAADAWGNAFVSTTLTATVTADTIAPTVTSVVQYDKENIDVTFSEAVTGADVKTNYTLKDADGNTVTINSATQQGTSNTYRLNTAVLAGGAYTLSIAADVIKDTSYNQNKLAAYTATVNITDKVAPTVSSAVYSSDKKKVQVNFSEAMDAAVLNASNYQIAFDGVTRSALPTGTTVSWGADNKSVVFTFTAAQAFTGTPQVYVAQVADVAGNKTAAFENVVNLTVDNITTANIVADSIKAVATDTIQFQLNTALSAIDVNKFTINGVGANSATYVNDGGKATVTVKTPAANKFGSDKTGLAVTAISVAANGFTSSFGTQNSGTVDILAADVKDYVAPSITGRTIADTDADSKYDTVTVTFSEALQVSSVAYDAFTVEGYTVSNVTVSGNTATISLTEKSSADLGATPKVQLVKAVRDNSAQFNVLAAETAGTAVTASVTGVAAAAVSVVDGVAAVKASKAIADLTYTADAAGVGGNSISIEYANPGANNAALAVTVTGNAIKVNLVTDSTGALVATSNTADAIKSAIEASTAAAALVDVTVSGIGTNAQGVTAATNLTGGADATNEVATLTITAGATNAGSVAVTVNGSTTYVAVAAGDDAPTVAGKIRTALTVAGYTVGGAGADVTFTATATGNVTNLTATVAN